MLVWLANQMGIRYAHFFHNPPPRASFPPFPPLGSTPAAVQERSPTMAEAKKDVSLNAGAAKKKIIAYYEKYGRPSDKPYHDRKNWFWEFAGE
jgi:hypothetical protein